jgi:hypothetical protein
MSEPTPDVGILAEPSYHVVATTHVQAMIHEALSLAAQVDGVLCDGRPMELQDGRTTLPIMTLDRAANLLRHAAEEIMDERHRASGWPPV